MRLAVLRRAVTTVAAALACVIVLAVALGFAGPLGLVVAADCLAVSGLVAVIARTPRGTRADPVRFLCEAVSWATRGRFTPGVPRTPALKAADFPAYLKINSDLGWAPVSMWHYDHGIRPLLSRLAQTLLAERHRVDPATDPQRARELLGPGLWPLVDPSRPASFDSRAPGADARTLTRIVDRLEQL